MTIIYELREIFDVIFFLLFGGLQGSDDNVEIYDSDYESF